jgi:hypothetical protein
MQVLFMTSRHLFSCLLLTLASAACGTASADWFFAPSTFSHSPQTGERVTQFAPIPPVYWQERPDYLRSGLRQTRSVIRTGRSLDSYHAVDRYGEEIRPYGEWLFPYRPYSVPYPAWGPPYGGFNGQFSGEFARQGFSRDPRWNNQWSGGSNWTGPGSNSGGGFWPQGGHNNPVESQSHVEQRINGLFDGQGIPGDDGHYLDQPRRLEQMNDREFFFGPHSQEH